ncbi:MAG: cytochrome b5 domain-containing protein, partial [Actinomycetota bacterium]
YSANSISDAFSDTNTYSTPSPTVREYTRADVAQRNTASSCWTIVDGNVYDLTSWINSHPGGPGVIRSLCGVDGSASFRAQHGRSARPNSILDGYLLGPLKR